MLRWICKICGKEAEYHIGDNGKHEYYCQAHWWKHIIQTREMANIRNMVWDGSGWPMDKR